MMNEKLYEEMDWARIEGLVYSEEDDPHSFLGATKTEEGILVQTYCPTAKSVTVHVASTDSRYPMDMEDESGFFAVLLPGKKIPDYTLEVEFTDGSTHSFADPYNFEPQIPESVLKKFAAGNCWELYRYLGAHPMTVNGTEGVYFAVWAPHAVRVSVVGDFNLWDGRRLPMRRLKEYGIFELFVPGLTSGALYKYEIKAKHGLTYLKSDPFSFQSELRPNTASIVKDLSAYEWGDQVWMEARTGSDSKAQPVSVYQVSLATFRVPDGEGHVPGYRELAEDLSTYVAKMGYTTVELFPLLEYSEDETMGTRPEAFFAPTSRYGSSEDFRYFIDTLHQKGIGVILDWDPSHFSRDLNGLSGFDGTGLYESDDPRQSLYKPDGSLYFNLKSPQVRNFLIASAVLWLKEYHIDGLQLADLSKLLYLDYGKTYGEWVPNIYGGNENLEAVSFLRSLSTVTKKVCPGTILAAEDASDWPQETGTVSEGGLGLDYKWNRGFRDALIEYIQLDPIFRGPHHQQLIFSMVYNYSEQFMLALSYEDVNEKYGSMYSKVPGRKRSKFANLRACYGYMFLHPGKKLLAMGNDIGQKMPLSEKTGVDWSALDHEENVQFQGYMAALLDLYRSHPALYSLDYSPEGFEWINNISANENMLVFLRKSEKEEEMLLCVVNFSALTYEDHKIGVPFAGKYKEIFNSDDIAFGGDGNVNPRAKSSKEEECDELPDSIRVLVPPMGISIFSCTKVEKKASGNEQAKAAVRKRRTAKKAAEEKTAEPKAEQKPKPQAEEAKAAEPKAEQKPKPQAEEAKAAEPKAEQKPKPQAEEAKAAEPKAEQKPQAEEAKAAKPKQEKKPQAKAAGERTGHRPAAGKRRAAEKSLKEEKE